MLQPRWHARGILFVFVLATPIYMPAVDMPALNAEYQKHGDMVLLSSSEVTQYAAGSRKTFGWAQFAAANAQRALFWGKADTDTLINPYALKLRLLQLVEEDARNSSSAGHSAGANASAGAGRWDSTAALDPPQCIMWGRSVTRTEVYPLMHFTGMLYVASADVFVAIATTPPPRARTPQASW